MRSSSAASASSLLLLFGTLSLNAAAAHASTPVDVQEGHYARVSGVVGHNRVGIPGVLPQHDAYVELHTPIAVQKTDGSRTAPLDTAYLRNVRALDDGAQVVLCGRIEIETTRSVETGRAHDHLFLTGLTYVSAGEPCFNGEHFLNRRGEQLPVARVPYDPNLPDLPNQFVVADVAGQTLFVGNLGGFIPPQANPFHGLTASPMLAPAAGDLNVDRATLMDLHLSYGRAPAQGALLLDPTHVRLYYFDAHGELLGVANVKGLVHVPRPFVHAAVAAAVPPVFVTDQDSGATVAVPQGADIWLKLPVAARIGYAWTLLRVDAAFGAATEELSGTGEGRIANIKWHTGARTLPGQTYRFELALRASSGSIVRLFYFDANMVSPPAG